MKNVKFKVLSVECHHLTQPWQCYSQITCTTTRLKCCACRAKWRWRSLKRCLCHGKWNSLPEKDAKVLHLSHKTIVDTFVDTWERQEVPCLPRHYNLLGNLQKGELLQLPPKTRRRQKKSRESRQDMLEPQNERFVRDALQFSHFVASKSTCSYEFSLEPQNLQLQNRCFVRGFRQFSAHLTKCHACNGIRTLSPLHAALTMRFAKNEPQDTSKVF